MGGLGVVRPGLRTLRLSYLAGSSSRSIGMHRVCWRRQSVSGRNEFGRRRGKIAQPTVVVIADRPDGGWSAGAQHLHPVDARQRWAPTMRPSSWPWPFIWRQWVDTVDKPLLIGFW